MGGLDRFLAVVVTPIAYLSAQVLCDFDAKQANRSPRIYAPNTFPMLLEVLSKPAIEFGNREQILASFHAQRCTPTRKREKTI